MTAAAQIFQEKGYDAGSLDDVAEILDMRRASLYYYVQSKANLLNMILERALDAVLEKLDDMLLIADPIERLEALIRHQVQTVAGAPTLFHVYFEDRPRLDEAYEQAIHKREQRYLDVYRRAVEAATDAGGIEDTGESRYVTQAIFGMATWCYKWFRPERDNIEEVADVCVSLILGEGSRPRRASA